MGLNFNLMFLSNKKFYSRLAKKNLKLLISGIPLPIILSYCRIFLFVLLSYLLISGHLLRFLGLSSRD